MEHNCKECLYPEKCLYIIFGGTLSLEAAIRVLEVSSDMESATQIIRRLYSITEERAQEVEKELARREEALKKEMEGRNYG